MKKILCPTDFSDAANDAVAYAAKLCHATGAALTLLHVQSLFDVTAVFQQKEKMLMLAKEELEAQSRQVAKTFKISCYAQVEQGIKRLSTAIRDHGSHFNLVVMGSNGPDDLYQLISGSNTYNAIVESSVPLLVIPAGYVYAEIKSIVYAFDYLRERDLPLGQLSPWTKVLGCELTVLQVMEEAYSKEAEEDLKELQFILQNRPDADVELQYDTIRSSDPAGAIDDYVRSKRPDALALCTVSRNTGERIFHKSVIKRISAICNYPVFVFHR